MSGIFYGEMISLDDSNILEASLLEQTSLSMDNLYAGELDVSILSLDDTFNIITNPGMFAAVQTNQELNIKLNKNELGTYYIDEFKVNDNILNLVCFDLIGVLEGKEFSGGLYQTGTTFATVLNQIISEANLEQMFGGVHNGFEVSQEILNKPIYGYVPITNCREALHMLCYAATVVAKCNRGQKIKIFELNEAISDTILDDRILLGTDEVSNNEKYTGVTLNAYSYVSSSESEQLVNEEYAVGIYKVTFYEPKHDFFASGATIISSSVNHVEFQVTTAGVVSITGKKYDITITPVTLENPNYYGTNKNIKQMADVTLVHPSYSNDVCQNQLKYYLKKYLMKADVIFNTKALADKVIIKDVSGHITKIETDLVKEDISSLEVVGDAKLDN